MTAIDSRAEVTCNLGEVIQGGISDSYLQNSGLVMTRGQLTLVGIQTPAIGSEVTISYRMSSGASGSIPRSLVVLSAFADPFRETTEVSVGCLLTYLDGVMPVPSLEDGSAAYTGPRQLECLNGLTPTAFVPPIFADQLFNYCCGKLGLTGGTTLSGTYMMDKYDLSGGYVSAIGNLLMSEGKVGYVTGTKTLTVIDLGRDPQGGVGLTTDEIIDVSSVNSGEQPASIVIVPYIDKKLEQYQPEEARWDEVETVGDQESVTLAYDGGSKTVTHAPSTKTITEYGEPVSLTDQCELKNGGFGDLSDTVVKTTTTRSTVLGHASSGYATALLDANRNVDTGLVGEIEEVTTFEFDEKDRPIRQTTEIYEPYFVYAGRLSLPWVFFDDDGEVTSSVQLGNEKVLVERTVEEIEYAGETSVPTGLKPGQDVSEPTVYQRVNRYTYQAWGKTQGGSQGPAESTTLDVFQTATGVLNFIDNSLGLVLTDSEVTANKTFNPKGQRRPGEADRAVQKGTIDDGGRATKYVELQFEGQGSGTRVVQYSPPHLTESYFTNMGAVVSVDSYAMSAKFGRVQHKLTLGNRLGMNVTTTPDKVELDPYAGLSVSAAGYAATYAVNGMNWSFGRDGIVASVDALYIGGNGIGGTRRDARSAGACWYYLPSDYDAANLPAVSEGQLIKPFNERVNMAPGVSLGCRVQSQRAQALVPQTVELGVALGVDGTVGNTKHVVHIGVALGVEAASSNGFVADVSIGVALGTDVVTDKATAKVVELGVKAGVNIGPALDLPWLLMNFDTDFSDQSPNNFVFADSGSGTMPSIHPSGSPASRFGPGCMTRDGTSQSGKVLDLGVGVQFNRTWTIEFWTYLTADSFRNENYRETFMSLKGDGQGWDIDFLPTAGASEPHLEVYEPPYTVIGEPTGPTIPLNQWVHIAVVAEEEAGNYGNELRLYTNGVRVALGYLDKSKNYLITHVCLGNNFRWSDKTVRYQYWYGFMDELRITLGKAVYTGTSFTPPTGPF